MIRLIEGELYSQISKTLSYNQRPPEWQIENLRRISENRVVGAE